MGNKKSRKGVKIREMHSALKAYNHMPKSYDERRAHATDFSTETKRMVNSNKTAISFKVAKAIFIGEAAVGKTSLG